MKKIKERSLYLVISEEYGCGRNPIEIAKNAIKGGVDMIQMREKHKPTAELVQLGKKLSNLCRGNGVIFIVNDDPMLAAEIGADGVHLGQEDMRIFSFDVARRIMGEDKIIGISTHSIEQFSEANEKGFDYIAFGPVFETKTKDYFLGAADIDKVINAARKPVFFIGGINFLNIDGILSKGAKNIALIRGILEAEDILRETVKYKNKLISEGRADADKD